MGAVKDKKAVSSKMTKKLRDDVGQVSWRKKKLERRAKREQEAISSVLIKNLENTSNEIKIIEIDEEIIDESDKASTSKLIGNQRKYYRISVAIPGSILNNAQSPYLRTYLAGEIARSLAIFCIDEVVIFDDTSRMTEEQRTSYYSKTWSATLHVNNTNVECNFHLAKILEYLECPQYLRKTAFPLQNALKYSGVLNPLDCTHHFRAEDLHVHYREGIILDKPSKKGHGPYCDVGLEKEVQIAEEVNLPPGVRVTLQINDYNSNSKKLKGKLTNPKRIRNETGLYWGYSVRIALSLYDAMYGKEYDYIIGTSDKGESIDDLMLPLSEKNRILVVFGGLQGLEAVLNSEERIKDDDPSKVFDYYLNSVPDQGSRIIRTEEAIPITLAILKQKLGNY